MKKSEKEKLTEATPEQITKRLIEEEKQLVKLRMQQKAGKTKDLHAFAKGRKTVAILKTKRRERQLAALSEGAK